MIGFASRILQWKAARFALAVLCLGLLAADSAELFPRQLGVDFYQFWGVPLAKRTSATTLSPYVDAEAYAGTLNAIADGSDSGKLRAANRLRRHLEPMGTPLLYASFSFLPDDYVRAQTLYAVIQFLAAGLAIFILARLRGVPPLLAVALAALVELLFNPFTQEVKVGNVNSLQLLFMAVLLYVAVRRRYTGRALVDGLFVGSLALFFIFKPNTIWIAGALALHYAATQGWRKFFVGAALAAGLALVAYGVGAWYFGNPGVWNEWLRFARALDGSGLPLTMQHGNVSLAMVISQGSSAYGSVGYGALIAASLLLAFLMAVSATGRRPDLAARSALEVFGDPWCALSLAVIFTFMTYPLVWPHYHLFALIPIFWLFRREGRWDFGTWCAVISFIAFSRPVLGFLTEAGFPQVSLALLLFAWVPLLPPVFLYIVERRRALEAAEPLASPAVTAGR